VAQVSEVVAAEAHGRVAPVIAAPAPAAFGAPGVVLTRVQRAERAVSSVVGRPGVVYLTFAASTFASLVGKDVVLSAFPFVIGHGRFSWKALAFWLLIALTGTVGWLKERKAFRDKAEEREKRQAAETKQEAAEAAARASQQELKAAVAQTALRLETIPPADLMGAFDEFAQKVYVAHLGVVQKGKGCPTPDDWEETLVSARFVLLTVASLVQKFEFSPVGVTFSANVMLFRPQSLIQGSYKAALQDRLRFVSSKKEITGLRGVLDMQRALSVRLDPASGSGLPIPDRGLPLMAMPVPDLAKSTEQGWLVLPGAPQAFCSGEMDVCQDVGDIIRRCDDRSVPKHLSSRIGAHLTDEVPHIQSFISVPIRRAGTAGTAEPPLGIVNINSSRTGIMKDPDRQELLLPLLRPLLWSLPEMIGRLDRPRYREQLVAY
jgi:hypothetical protein